MAQGVRAGRAGGRALSFFRLRGAAVPELDLRYVGRTLLHAAVVGAVAGTVGSLFFIALELTQRWFLEGLAGYIFLRAPGEGVVQKEALAPFRPWVLLIVPALGALVAGLLTAFVAPEAQGGGGDAILHAFHFQNGVVRRRVLWVKTLASIFTLGTGGSGGREGPTMQIGGAIGSLVGRYLKVSPRERRVLLVAGVAAGMAAVFRTPLGAALLAVEVLYRDDFEADALIPALLASVVSYSVFISYLGESTLFAHAPRYPFVPVHLPLYVLLALILAVLGAVFLRTLDGVRKIVARYKIPHWLRPAAGGLALGIVVTPVIVVMGPRVGQPGQGFGILGGGYGAAQIAITGISWLSDGWRGVELLLLMGLVKIISTSLTVGSGGSAGDFGPSLVMGGLFGGAFGRAAQLLLHDPRIDPGAFALVGMGTFYGGIAHVPVSSLVMVCELAGSYDLLVPLMLAEGVAFVALRKQSLYHAQLVSRRDSPVHRHDLVFHALEGVTVGEVLLDMKDRTYVTFHLASRAPEIIQRIASNSWQDAFPVLGNDGKMVGIINAEVVRTMAAERDYEMLTVAADLMDPPMSVPKTEKIHHALELMLRYHLRELPVVDDQGKIIGFLDEADITKAYLAAITPPDGERR